MYVSIMTFDINKCIILIKPNNEYFYTMVTYMYNIFTKKFQTKRFACHLYL